MSKDGSEAWEAAIKRLVAVHFNRPLSRGDHVESPENKKLCFCMSKLVLTFFTVRLDVQNVLFLC